MRQPTPVKRYALARSGTTAKARPEEGVRRLRLVRMEAIVELDRQREQTERTRR
jgi:hypothetical protein